MPLQATAPASSTGGSSVHEELDYPHEFSGAGVGTRALSLGSGWLSRSRY